LGAVERYSKKKSSSSEVAKPWLSDKYDMPVLENEEMWSQRVIDESDD
jgi:hypothetical protein